MHHHLDLPEKGLKGQVHPFHDTSQHKPSHLSNVRVCLRVG
jgi:hypothetical protein